MSEVIFPALKTIWQDKKYPERRLFVTEIRPKCKLWRNVVGLVVWEGRHTLMPYSTDMVKFKNVWVATGQHGTLEIPNGLTCPCGCEART